MAQLKDSLITGDLRVTGNIYGTLQGNATTATTLQTSRTINGANFNGSANITTANWGTARTVSISSTAGTTGTSVNGSGNVSLVVPSTMTGFASITSTSFVGALTGNASTASKLATARSLKVALGSTTAVTFDGSAAQDSIPVSGTLAIGNGGTGLTASPSMLTNLASTTAANVLQASPRPGVTGTLPVGNGGTGNTTGTATYATTTADTTNALYPVGVTSGATTTLKHDTGITMTGGTLVTNGSIRAGQPSNTREINVIAQSGAGKIYLYSTGSSTGNRGIYGNNNAGTGATIMSVDQSNNIGFSSVVSFTNTTASTSTTTGAVKISGGLGVAGNIYGAKVYNAVWNDYAEYRTYNDGETPYGKVVCENGDDSVSLSKKRLQKGAMICSNTFGTCMGDENNGIPIAVAGRALAYTMEPREEYLNHIGEAVCAGPNGTVSIMTKEEAKEYPECVIGYVSAVPNYEEWGTGNIKVDGRVWIKVK